MEGFLAGLDAFLEAVLAGVLGLVDVDAVLEAECHGSELDDEVGGHALQGGDGRLGHRRDDVADGLLHALLDEALDDFLGGAHGTRADQHRQATGDGCEGECDARFGGQVAELDQGGRLHGDHGVGGQVHGPGDGAGGAREAFEVLAFDRVRVLVQCLDRLVLARGEQPFDVVVRELAVVQEVLGELPERVRHVPVGVLVHIRPGHPDQIQQCVRPVRHRDRRAPPTSVAKFTRTAEQSYQETDLTGNPYSQTCGGRDWGREVEAAPVGREFRRRSVGLPHRRAARRDPGRLRRPAWPTLTAASSATWTSCRSSARTKSPAARPSPSNGA
ncbi:hypothetical protein [Streptomyces sp. NPDC002602]|uniref:hypothetical protein n=1 Tax=Streptomyces sp. NPDC002602 TaxID=3364654 RepID=UPI0036F1DB3D